MRNWEKNSLAWISPSFFLSVLDGQQVTHPRNATGRMLTSPLILVQFLKESIFVAFMERIPLSSPIPMPLHTVKDTKVRGDKSEAQLHGRVEMWRCHKFRKNSRTVKPTILRWVSQIFCLFLLFRKWHRITASCLPSCAALVWASLHTGSGTFPALFVPFPFPSMRHRQGQMEEKADVQDTHAHNTQFYLLYLWYIPPGKHAPQSCFLIKPLVRSPNYYWTWFILNLHLTEIRTPCTFLSKFSIIPKPHWFISCFYFYLCCTAHHTFYTSEHHFLPLHKCQHCRSEHRSRGLSPHSCLGKKRRQRWMKCKRDALRAR